MSKESKPLTFKEKYNETGLSWQNKAMLISLYHIAMCLKFPTWTLSDTSTHFNVSIGLVSENLKLARYIDHPKYGPKLMKTDTREHGLRYVNSRN